MSLSTYKKKRRFNETPEPSGKAKAKSGKKLSFVVQRHDASHLHFDFRLEVNGVLKSWAVPKGPSLNPSDKRLAVMVEDHPLAYGKFEGEIPEGNYGAGTVEIWDNGTYTLVEDESTDQKAIEKQLAKGSLKFIMHGKKLKGSFALVRLKDGKNWLLMKHKDDYAVDEAYDPDEGRKEKTSTKKAAKKSARKTSAVKRAPRKVLSKKTATVVKDEDTSIKIGGHTLKLSNLTKLYWPDEHITKGDLINYYVTIHKYILPYLKDRPQSLRRNPNGIGDSGFFHKDVGDAAPDWVKHQPIYSEGAKKDIDYIICNNLATLTYLNNLGCIEINPWNSTLKHLDNPDYLIMDIDPGEKNTFNEVIDTALVIKEILDRAGAPCYCKTSGASGLHVYIPLHAAYSYDEVRDFAQLIALLTEQQLPDTTTTERSLNKRKGRLYIDYLQNKRGQTLASVYSVRPVQGACVSTPLSWKEVKHGLKPTDFTIFNIKERVEKKGDLFGGVLKERINLAKCLKALS
jgi:bifunctional non-homologous end joining protein LigD